MSGEPPEDAQDQPPPQEQAGPADPPDPEWDERVEVRVPLGHLGEVPLGSSAVTFEPDVVPGVPEALTSVVTAVPGVSENGQGGLFQVYSIRGVSRQRVTAVLAGMRLTSERRAGTSASFLDPLLMQRIEVLRGPATTLYGSGALGGVVRIEPRTFNGWALDLGYDTNGDQNYQVVGVGDAAWSFGLAHRGAEDGEAADGTRLHSEFDQYSAVLQTQWKRGPMAYELVAIPSSGRDIGKPNTDYPVRTTDYPSESHGVIRFAAESDRDWRLEAAIHAQDLETRVVETDRQLQSNVFNDSVDGALRWQAGRPAGKAWTVSYGVEAFGRGGVDAEELQQDLSQPDAPATLTQSLDGASELELGLHGAARSARGKTRFEVGLRVTGIEQSNAQEPERRNAAVSGQAGILRPVGGGFQLRGNIASGVRFPSLTELFFDGTTGRGVVTGNPALDPERSASIEFGTQWASAGTVVEATIFATHIGDYIERVELAPDSFTFVNVTSGQILGIELQGQARPVAGVALRWGGHLIEGEDDDGVPMDDTPPPELMFGAARTFERWRIDGGLTWRGRRDDPGPGEKPIPSAELLEATVGYRFNDAWEVALGGKNLLDQIWFPSADDKASPGAGRSFFLRLVRRGI